MHKKFDHQSIEKKWQARWKESGIYDVTERDPQKEKEYVLVEWPYPSGNLHIGHWYAFAVPDMYVRAHRMQGKQVLYPMGFDAFGLPAENAAIKRNLDPKEWTDANIAFMKGQLESMGAAFTWNRTTSSTDPEYYRWTQWMFTKFFERDIAYRGVGIVNWCPGCNTVIANEQVLADGTCERSGDVIEKREMPQWMLRITSYADRLVDDLDVLSWPEPIKEAQRQWIGRSKGALIDFTITFKLDEKNNEWRGEDGKPAHVTVFTTRADTLYGATYLVLAPEHPWVAGALAHNRNVLENADAVEAYVRATKQKDDIERTNVTKEKTGVELRGIKAINPATGEEIPVYIADYVLASYGTGAIMAVPAHDERDGDFAKKFNLPIRPVVIKHLTLGGADAMRDGVETLIRNVVDIIIEHPTDGTFLVMKEVDESGRTHVHFVGGGTDGESDEVAIGRELKEETGFTDYEILGGPYGINSCEGFRHTKQKNQVTKGGAYHIKLTTLDRVSSEVEEGKHTIEWMTKDEVLKNLNWDGHRHEWESFLYNTPYTNPGRLINSGEFDGMDSEAARDAIIKKVGGRISSTYRLRDWSIGRQRYWGVPVPIVYDEEGRPHAIPEEHLPWLLPTDVDFRPTGEAPLAKSKELKERTEKIFGKGWTPEVETMDTFVDSSWYFLRYLDAHNDTSLSSKKLQEEWMPIDLYFGGAEHTTMHLLYSRFWQKVLFDLDLVTVSEPYKKRINRSLVLGPDGNKMSKSKGNVIDPDEQVHRLGADTVRMYLAFMGPYGETSNYPWDMGGIAGIRRFLERVYGLSAHIVENEEAEVTSLLHRTIKKVTDDIEMYKFNTAISALMIFLNTVEKKGCSESSYITFITLLAPFAPHLTEELWNDQKQRGSIHQASWPTHDERLTTQTEVKIAVQIKGKVRGTITIPHGAGEDAVIKILETTDPLRQRLATIKIKKTIYVPNKIINLIPED